MMTHPYLCIEEPQIPGAELAAAFGQILGAMRNLAHMSVEAPYQQPGLPAAAFQQARVGSMQYLQSFSLSSIKIGKGMVLELPASLTRLQLGWVTGRGLVPETVQDLALGRLTNLVHLELSEVPIDGAVLTGVSQLQCLILRDVTHASKNWHTRRTDSAYVLSRQTCLAGAILRALRQMTQLQRLELSDVPLHRVTNLQLFRALAASTGLEYLQLQQEGAAPLPAGALQHMLTGRQLPQLRVLSLCNQYKLKVLTYGAPSYDGPCVSAAELTSIDHVCPALQELTLQNVVTDAQAVTALVKGFKSVTSLIFSGEACGDAAVVEVVKMTGLRSLAWLEHAVPLEAPSGYNTHQRCSTLSLKGLRALFELPKGLTQLQLGCLGNT